jgi:hypothetical protein
VLNSLSTRYQLVINLLSTCYQLVINLLSICYQLVVINLLSICFSTFYQLFINFLSTFKCGFVGDDVHYTTVYFNVTFLFAKTPQQVIAACTKHAHTKLHKLVINTHVRKSQKNVYTSDIHVTNITTCPGQRPRIIVFPHESY